MIRREINHQRGFALVKGRKYPRRGAYYFKEKWENGQGESGLDFTQALWEARVFKTCKHARAMRARLADADVQTVIVKVEDERRRIWDKRRGEARRN